MNLDSLVSDLKPVRPAARLWARALAWSALAAGLTVGASAWLGLRPDPQTPLPVLLALFAVLFAASHLCLSLAIPGRRIRLWQRLAPVAGIAAFYLVLGLHPVEEAMYAGHPCTLKLIALALVPGLVLLVALRRLAAVEPGRAARLAGLAMGAAGAFGLSLHCTSVHCLHLLLYHGLPVLILSLAVQAFGSRLLRW